MWDGNNWQDAQPPKSPEEQTKSITTISGSKYNYTTQVGDALISYGFDTHDELSRFVKAECHCDKPAKKITVQEFKDRLDRETK